MVNLEKAIYYLQSSMWCCRIGDCLKSNCENCSDCVLTYDKKIFDFIIKELQHNFIMQELEK